MEKGFTANQLRPGDPGFEYDKVIDFSKADPGELDDDSWEESGDEGGAGVQKAVEEEDEDSEMDYFDDDFN